MPIKSNTLKNTIDKDKTKRNMASKIIETNPKTLGLMPKLTVSPSMGTNPDESMRNLNMSVLEGMHSRMRSLRENNKNIVKLFPDLEIAIQIIVSSILSPKTMTDSELIYKLHKDFSNNPVVTAPVLSDIKTYIDDTYELEEKLPEIIREALFTSGAYVQLLVPEASVDDVINKDLSNKYSMESYASGVDNLLATMVDPINLPKRNTPAIENISNERDLVEAMISSDLVRLTDNPGVLRFSKIKDKISKSLIRNSMRTGIAVSAESMEKISYLDIFRQRNTVISQDKIEYIKTKTNASRKSIGKPMSVRIPTESTIPVFVPGSTSEHVAYLILLDSEGKPLDIGNQNTDLNTINNTLTINPNTQLSPVQKAYKNLVFDSTSGMNTTEIYNIYKNVIEKQLFNTIRDSVYNSDVDISNKNDIYFTMFVRALSDQKTNILYVPKELITYYAFQYNEMGVGKSLLENMSILTSLRAILLFSKVMAQAKQSIDVTKVNISLDPDDPDPEKTIEMLQDSVLKLRQNFLPLGINNPVDLVNWIQKAGLQFEYENNPRVPDVKLSFENSQLAHTMPDSDLDEDLRKQTILALGLSPETIDSGFSPEFATTIVNNNVLMSKRIAVYQRKLLQHVTEFIRSVINNDEDLRTVLRENIHKNIENILERASEDEKELALKDKNAFIEEYIDSLSEHIEISLPLPDNTNLVNLSAEYEVYRNGLDAVLNDAVISTDFFTDDLTGELSGHIDSIRNSLKSYYLRKWMSDNNYYPETLEIANIIEEDDLPNSPPEIISSYLTNSMSNAIKLMSKMRKFKDAANIDLGRVLTEGEEGASGPSEGSSSSSIDDSSNNESEEGGGEEGGDDIVSDDDIDMDW